MMMGYGKIAATLFFTCAIAGCATRPAVQPQTTAPDAASGKRLAKPERPKTEPLQTKPAAPATAAAPVQDAVRTEPVAAPSAERQLAILRVEAGALVTRVNGDRQLACTKPECKISLPPGTHTFTVGYKDTETRAGSRVTFASMHSRDIEVTLEPGHSYSLTASGRYAPRWWIAVEDTTAKKTVYNDRQRPE